MSEQVVRISQLRECLGIACQHVATTDEPIIVQRYSRQEVAIVPLWEWRFLKEVDQKIRAGERPWEEEDGNQSVGDERENSRGDCGS